MSTLSVTTVSTANGTTDLTLVSGNSSAGDVVISSNGTLLTLSGNSSTNTLTLSPNGHFVFANATANSLVLSTLGDLTVTSNLTMNTNNKSLRFTTLNATAYATMVQQNDDNFVFYSTNTTGGQRAIFSVFANSVTSNVNFSVPINVNGNVGITTNTVTLGTSTIAANGYTYLPNGLKANFGNFAANSTVGNATFASAFTTLYTVHLSSGNSLSNSYFLSSATTSAVQGRTSSVANPGGLLYYWAIGV